MKKIYIQPSLKLSDLGTKAVLYTTSIQGGGEYQGEGEIPVDAKRSAYIDDSYFDKEENYNEEEWGYTAPGSQWE